jgi:hypothetical protein
LKKETSLLVLAVMLLGVGALIIHVRGVGGFNYNAYNYFSGLYFNGLDPYHPPFLPERVLINESFRRPSYLDYTGFQLAIYNLCYLVRHHIWWRLDGYVLYSLLFWFLALLGVYELRRKAYITPTHYFSFVAMLFAPYLWYVLFVRSYEDKAIYLLLPVAIPLLHHWSPLWATGILGALTGVVGVPVLVLPVLLLSVVHKTGFSKQSLLRMTKLSAVFSIGFFVSMVPFFPESLLGWARRSALELALPSWFSGWRILGDLYFPGLNNATLLVACGIVYLLYGYRRMTFNASVVVLLTFPFFFSVTMGSQRILPAVATMVLAFSTRRWLLAYAVTVYPSLLLFLWLDVSRGLFFSYPVHHATMKSVLLLLPCALGYGFLVFEGIAEKSSPNKASNATSEPAP